MGTREKIERLEAEQLKLKAQMQDDGRAIKCFKMGISFAESYPEDYNAYIEANRQYNENEKVLEELKEELKKEEENEEILRRNQQMDS